MGLCFPIVLIFTKDSKLHIVYTPFIVNVLNTNIFSLLYLFRRLGSDPAVMERNIKRLKDEQSKSRGQDAGVLQNLLSVTFSARHQQLVAVSDGKKSCFQVLERLAHPWPRNLCM